jgi:hypothetical protein
VFEDVQVTDDVRGCVVASEKVPVAVNCGFIPRGLLGLTGVTAMDTSVAEVTVRFVVPNIPVESVALIVVTPTATVVASPLEPVALLIVAIDPVKELHVTDNVKSCVVLSEKVPVAVNCGFIPRGLLGLTGVTAMDVSVTEVDLTVSVV